MGAVKVFEGGWLAAAVGLCAWFLWGKAAIQFLISAPVVGAAKVFVGVVSAPDSTGAV